MCGNPEFRRRMVIDTFLNDSASHRYLQLTCARNESMAASMYLNPYIQRIAQNAFFHRLCHRSHQSKRGRWAERLLSADCLSHAWRRFCRQTPPPPVIRAAFSSFFEQINRQILSRTSRGRSRLSTGGTIPSGRTWPPERHDVQNLVQVQNQVQRIKNRADPSPRLENT